MLKIRQVEDEEFTVHQVGELWYVVNSRGSMRSQGYRTQTMAALMRDHLEWKRDQQVFYREGEGHD